MVAAALCLVLVWLALTRSFDPASWVAGALATTAALLAQRWLLPHAVGLGGALWRRPHHAIAFLATLLVRLAQSTAYTCRVILFCREEGRIVALSTELRDPGAQFVLSNAITLTPSTISLLLEDDLLYVHWLGVRGETGDWRGIKDSLERRLLRFVEGRNGARD